MEKLQITSDSDQDFDFHHKKLTKAVRERLVKVRDFISKQKRVNMEGFIRGDNSDDLFSKDEVNKCGSNCCIVGHSLKIDGFYESYRRSKYNRLKGYYGDWVAFSSWILGRETTNNNFLKGDGGFDFLFGAHWKNSIKCAVNRINYVLEHGLVVSDGIDSCFSYIGFKNSKKFKKLFGNQR